MFVMQTVMYFSAYEEFFHDDRKKALWFLQWFGGEAPRMWATGVILTATTANEHPGISNWKKLLEESSAMWGPTDLISDATRKLRVIRQNKSVAEYHADFIQHAFISGYNDRALAETFYFGLRGSIKDMMIHEERPDTLPKMLEMALRLEARILARMGERRGEETKNPYRASAKAARLSPQQRTEYMKAGKCFECAKTGHRARNCPDKNKEPTQVKKTNKEETKPAKKPKPAQEQENEEETEEEDFQED